MTAATPKCPLERPKYNRVRLRKLFRDIVVFVVPQNIYVSTFYADRKQIG